jgi:hypothetical protein
MVSLLEEGLREVAWYIKKKETTLLGPPGTNAWSSKAVLSLLKGGG